MRCNTHEFGVMNFFDQRFNKITIAKSDAFLINFNGIGIEWVNPT